MPSNTYIEQTLTQQIPCNATIMESGPVITSTETPPPGYISEDGDPMDINDNLSKFLYYLFVI